MYFAASINTGLHVFDGIPGKIYSHGNFSIYNFTSKVVDFTPSVHGYSQSVTTPLLTMIFI